ncbi:MAG: hypothetical protein J6R41_03800 [Paludibacteraceae bacterium]|nr:hypothetical protein [Paludibacteraceae bacterium]
MYNYDTKGNETEATYYKSDGSLGAKFIYNYDTKGNKTEAAEYTPDGTIRNKYIYKYDAQGNVTEETEYKGEMQKPESQDVYTIIYRK